MHLDARLTLTMPDGKTLTATTTSRNRPRPAPDVSHSPDFAAVRWNGKTYTLTGKQRDVIAVLWRAWEDDVHYVSGALLLEEAESNCGKLSQLFRRSDAWGKLIVPGVRTGGALGTYRLAPRDVQVESA
jgi:hypothetical protein